MEIQIIVKIETTDESFTDPDCIPKENIVNYIKVKLHQDLLNICCPEDLTLISIRGKIIK